MDERKQRLLGISAALMIVGGLMLAIGGMRHGMVVRIAAGWLGVAAGVYGLYESGLLIIKSRRALTFIGSIRGKRCSATFTSCSGTMRRVVRFGEDQTCRLRLEAELKQGDLAVELLDARKQPVMRLDREHPCMEAQVSKGMRYHLVFRFQSASGRYVLEWM